MSDFVFLNMNTEVSTKSFNNFLNAVKDKMVLNFKFIEAFKSNGRSVSDSALH